MPDNIKTTQEELSDILMGFAKSTIGGEPSEEVPAATETIVEEPKVEEKPVGVSTAQPAAETKPTEETKKEETKDEIFSDWNIQTEGTPVVTEATSTAPDTIFSDLGKTLGLEKVSSKEELVTAVTSLKTELEKAKGPDTTEIHPELLKAIELSRKGGDFYEYLKVTSVDYSKADPVQLYEDYVIDQLTDDKGNVNEDEVNDYLDNMKDSEKRLKGIELQRRLVYEQQRKVSEIEGEALRKREKQDTDLKAALGNLQEIDGFKVSDSDRKAVFGWVTGKMMKDLFYSNDGSLDPVKVAKVAFRNLYHDKLHSYMSNKIKNAGKREIYAEITNAQITTPSAPANPTTKKGYDINDYISSLEQKLINK